MLLTVLSQLGGAAWVFALFWRRRLLVFVLGYGLLSVGALWLAPLTGRVPLSCSAEGPLQVHSRLYCVLNRQYVTPQLAETLQDLAQDMDQRFPGTVTQVLDANFPFLTGFPLLPHLSHHDGRKVDIAFYYQNDAGYQPGATRSPLGYFAFEQGPTTCPARRLSLRWDMAWLQPMFASHTPEPERMRAVMIWLSKDPRIHKVFLEPHLRKRWELTHPKIRFQGCRAARHDDHIHMQL